MAFHNQSYYPNINKEFTVIPKSKDKNNIKSLNKVDVKLKSDKTYDQIRDKVEGNERQVSTEVRKVLKLNKKIV